MEVLMAKDVPTLVAPTYADPWTGVPVAADVPLELLKTLGTAAHHAAQVSHQLAIAVQLLTQAIARGAATPTGAAPAYRTSAKSDPRAVPEPADPTSGSSGGARPAASPWTGPSSE